jgi:hypothetical protein
VKHLDLPLTSEKIYNAIMSGNGGSH